MRWSKTALRIFAATLLAACITVRGTTEEPRGWLVIEGGSYPFSPVVAQKFRELIGGADAKVLIIPTALDDKQVQSDLKAGLIDAAARDGLGLRNYEVFNTHDRQQADREEFASRIRSARGIWFNGGRPGRIAEAYLGTRTQRELKSFYVRGGVIGGTSAGALILSSFLVRGGVDDEDFRRLISQKNRTGFGFLPNAVIDVHVSQRHGEGDLTPIVAANPELLGIGVDAGTAIVVHGKEFEVIGGPTARVTITDGKQHDGTSYYFLKRGDHFDLSRRMPITAP